MHSSSPDGARQYDNMNVWTCFGRLWMQLDVNVLLARSRISCSRLRMELDVIFYMLHSLDVSLGSSTLWSHSFHYVLVVCGCSSITFVQTCSQISYACLWMELNFSVAHVTCTRRLHGELDNMNTYFSSCLGRLWMQLDHICKDIFSDITWLSLDGARP